MLDIKFVRENPEAVKKDLQKRNDREKLEWIDYLLHKDSTVVWINNSRPLPTWCVVV